METPVEVDFQGTEPIEWLRESIISHIAKLEDRFGRLTACRVVLKAPGEHHQTGLYEINIRLVLPNGREVNVAKTAIEDERYGDPTFAVNDTFKRARRRLQDQVRRMQGQVKTHVAQPIGAVTELNAVDGFGFLTTEDGREIYFHRNSVLNDAFDSLKIGTRVSFAEEAGEKGPQASTVKILGKHGMR
jgi:cold shock CspA family protein